MIKKALEYIVGLNKAEVMDINEITYTDKHLTPVYFPLRKTLQTHTLQSLIEYIQTKDGDIFFPKYIHVEDNQTVSVKSVVESVCGGERNIYTMSNAMLPTIIFNRYLPMEDFIIQLNTCFDRNQGNWKDLLALASTMQLKDEVKVSDDGISQEVTAKQGVARLADVTIPNPVYLAPMRTFHEVEQVLVPFVYRVDKNGNMGLFEADGGAWKLDAIKRIQEYIENNLPKDVDITILA